MIEQIQSVLTNWDAMLPVLPQLVVSGIAIGMLYALIALSMTILYRATTVVNFGHGDLVMVGAYALFILLPMVTFNIALESSDMSNPPTMSSASIHHSPAPCRTYSNGGTKWIRHVLETDSFLSWNCFNL